MKKKTMDRALLVKMSTQQLKRLRKAAKEADVSMAEYLRRSIPAEQAKEVVA